MKTDSTRPFALTLAAPLLAFVLLLPAAHATTVVDFEDLGLTADSSYNGADGAGGFTSGAAQFSNKFTNFGTFTAWEGWAASTKTDVTTGGFLNEFSAYNLPAGGGDNSSTYAVAFGAASGVGEAAVYIEIPNDPISLRITNTTYGALAMQEGSAFNKKFGGESGDDADFFELTITGREGGPAGSVVGNVLFSLADFSAIDNSNDFIVDAWTTVDLTGLAGSDTLTFLLESSDVGQFGMNNPAYFAVDNLTLVPEPSTAALALLAAVALGLIRTVRRR